MRPDDAPRSRAVTRVTAVLFCVLLAALFVCFWALPDKDFSPTEKRVLALFPAVSFSRVADGTFESELETYVQDQMPLRNAWVGLCAYFNAFLGQNGTDGAYVCREDYLINTPSHEDFRNLRSNLKYLGRFSDGVQTPVYLLPVPQTGYVLQELLPQRHAAYTDDRIFAEIVDEAAETLRIVDVRDAFCSDAAGERLYYKTDHHWTPRGALTAANVFLTTAGRPTLSDSDFRVEKVPGFYGTIYSKLALWGKRADTMELWHIPNAKLSVTVQDLGKDTQTTASDVFFRDHLDAYDMYPVYLDGNHSFTTIENEAAPEGTLLLLKDSFGNTIATELAAAYRRIVMIDLRYYRTKAVSDLLAEYNVDDVLVCYSVDSLMHDTNILWLR